MNAIFSMDDQFGIGNAGGLLYSLPEDMRFFRRTTLGKVVVMGRKTLLSLPGGLPLKDRTNIVLTRDPGFAREGVTCCRNEAQLFAALAGYAPDDCYVIGGKSIYEALLPCCRLAYVTRIFAVREADSRLAPDILAGWRERERSAVREHEGIRYAFCVYENPRPLP